MLVLVQALEAVADQPPGPSPVAKDDSSEEDDEEDTPMREIVTATRRQRQKSWARPEQNPRPALCGAHS